MTKALFDAFRDAMMANPVGSRKEAMIRFVAEMESDPAYLEKLAMDYFERMSAVWTVSGEEHNHTFGRTGPSIERGERISQAKTGAPRYRLAPRNKVAAVAPVRDQLAPASERTATAFEELRAKARNVVLLDLVMPNGKSLRYATGAECEKAGGFYAEVAKSIKPTQVVDRHLTEGDLLNIRARFYRTNRGSAA